MPAHLPEALVEAIDAAALAAPAPTPEVLGRLRDVLTAPAVDSEQGAA